MKPKPSILVFTERYLPGYKGGGPIRTLAYLIDQLGDEFHFKVLTTDRDSGDQEAYPGILPEQWYKVGRADVMYLDRSKLSVRAVRRLISSTEHDVIYLNSFFEFQFSIMPLLLRRMGHVHSPVILAPRGEFSPGAIALKYPKKRTYLAASIGIGLYENVVWQASSVHEKTDIRRWFARSTVAIAPDVAAPLSETPTPPWPAKEPGALRIVFLSRIARKKNLDYAIRCLGTLQGQIDFRIYGPLEDQDYWAECQRLIANLPGNIKVSYCGAVRPEAVTSIMAQHDLFLFPTHGENFGHVILEALVAGCPVLLSDQTPWQGLEEATAGWVHPLSRPDAFKAVLQRLVGLERGTYESIRVAARDYGRKHSQDVDVLEQNRKMFLEVARTGLKERK